MVPLLLIVYLGGYPLLILAALIGAVGVRELYQGFENMGIYASYPIAIGLLVVLYIGAIFWPNHPGFLTGWLAAAVIASSLYNFKIKEREIEDGMATMLGLIYVIFFSFHVVLVDRTGPYSVMIWLVLLSAFATDIFAYFTGMAIGKHKLCPNLSPKKTIEGAVGGIVGEVICSLLFARLACPELTMHVIFCGILASVLSMCGDLTASAYKRQMGIKDYGNLIPGHGGILDRFDSVLFTAPAVYYYILFVMM